MIRPSRHPHDDNEMGFDPLRVIAAQLLLATAADLAFGAHGRTAESAGRTPAMALRVPAAVAPLAATAHLAHMSSPSRQTSAVARALDTVVVAAGVGSALAGLLVGGGRRSPVLSTLALASAGVLGLIIDRHEKDDRAERTRLERRASVVERLVPRRRPRIDHVVVHA